MEKGIGNVSVIACKLVPALMKVTNNRLEVAKKERRKKEEIKKGRKQKLWLSNGPELEEDESDIGNDTDLD